ncbi:MAG: putative SAM-dependent methyltransferase [Phycisphaerales bacterium]|nr:putative SAM-dependent methyltransferase [Phycisphaerales bacterium]
MFRPIRERFFDVYAVKSYSQEGEDRILHRLFERRDSGFYVDVGAHHPRRFSNTNLFYQLGWRGINIDATPGVKALFDQLRPRDVTIEAAISRDGRELDLREYSDGALNTLTDSNSSPTAQAAYAITKVTRVTTRRLADVLREHMETGQHIDFMSVDVEGMDLEVLEGNDWTRYRPRYLLVECFGASLSEVERSPIGIFLRAQGYEAFAKAVHTYFFRDAPTIPNNIAGCPKDRADV